ncbi:hypothetical protein [Maridesulfovibrio sp.]|uniref:hypothetical protein n=1 Tax=Maridesulfovibrio sp. TaxID=2795000 RepID=UPI0029C9BF81|nr:hypothetical protein [Maridesulfovibrio sp.]
MENLKNQLVEYLPPVFAATSLDSLTGNAMKWRTVQNIRARVRTGKGASGESIPNECFLRDGKRKVLIVRDPFLDWWLARLSYDESFEPEGTGDE